MGELCCDVGMICFFPLSAVPDLGRGVPVISRSWFRQGRYKYRHGGGAGSQGYLVCGYLWNKKAMFGSIDDLFIYSPTLKSHYHDYRGMDEWNAC